MTVSGAGTPALKAASVDGKRGPLQHQLRALTQETAEQSTLREQVEALRRERTELGARQSRDEVLD